MKVNPVTTCLTVIADFLLYLFLSKISEQHPQRLYSQTYGKAKNWLLKTGACFRQINFHFLPLMGSEIVVFKGSGLFNTGGL